MTAAPITPEELQALMCEHCMYWDDRCVWVGGWRDLADLAAAINGRLTPETQKPA